MWTPIVIGILKQKGGRALLGLRPSQAFMGNYWEFPGGKMELGETPEEALVRELKEELGVTEVTLGSLGFASASTAGAFDKKRGSFKPTPSTFSTPPNTSMLLLFYEVKIWKGTPKPLYHRELKWVQAQDLGGLDLLPANKAHLKRLCEMIEKE